MKFLTDENIGLEVVNFLRKLGHNTVSVIEENSGADDVDVLKKAFKESRVLITSDKDFGELIYFRRFQHKGVILLRLRDETNKNKIKVISNLLASFEGELKNKYVVVTEAQIRFRKSVG